MDRHPRDKSSFHIIEQIKKTNNFDKLTGLYNQNYWLTEVDRLSKERGASFLCIILDADDLKKINDSPELGHLAGDQLLYNIASSLKEVFRPSDVIARIGGDEFGVLIEIKDNHSIRPEEVSVLIDETKKRLIPHQEKLQFSFGVSFAGDGDLYQGLRQADILMYKNKKLRKENSIK